MVKNSKHPLIPEVFNEKCVLVTGATGFLGKVLVEKLLRSCPGITTIYVLLRASVKGQRVDVDERLYNLKNTPVFNGLRKDSASELDKLIALEGCIEENNLGLSGEQLRTVIKNVSFIFHCAANVRFDDEPSNTLRANLLGVKNVLDVCRQCVNLKAFVHTSTAYAYAHLPETSEIIYPELVQPQHIIEALEWMTDEQLRYICKFYDQGRQSLYQFSKALAENLIAGYEGNLPAIIVRPSIVTASFKEPYPGWIDNYNGPTGFIVVCGKGIVKTLLVEPTVNADWVPVDIVANTLIAAAHYITVNNKPELMKLDAPSRVPVINCTCPPENAITWMKVVDLCLPYLIKYPSMDIYGKPGGTVTSSKFRYAMCRLMSHHIPAYFIDGLLYVTGKTPIMIQLYQKIHRVMGHLEHYTTHPYTFHSPNMRELISHLPRADSEDFLIDQREIDWDSYIDNYVIGTRRYYLDEEDETLPEAQMRMMRMHYLGMAVKATSSMIGLFLFLYATRKHLPPMPKMPSFQFLSIIFMLQKKFFGI